MATNQNYRVVLKSGETLDIEAASVQNDGLGKHLVGADGSNVATFGHAEVTSIYPAPKSSGSTKK